MIKTAFQSAGETLIRFPFSHIALTLSPNLGFNLGAVLRKKLLIKVLQVRSNQVTSG